jgi:L-seryl-tRNA(Ser) seleniumtransferase
VEAVLQQLACQDFNGIPRRLLAQAVRETIEARRRLLAGSVAASAQLDRDALTRDIADEAFQAAHQSAGPYYRKAINATGIILHTGLGRAVLPNLAVQRIAAELAGYSVLQVDEETGKRSRRDARIEWLVRQLTGAPAATVINNNAAATLIALSTIARGREVIVSRGQLVEIGGSFRLPEVMALSGAKLVEVGTTNKTHPRDYERAITENTAAILRVHPSNYWIEGFTAEVPLETLVQIAHDNNLPLIDDVGAGALIDYRRLGLPAEPTLPDSIRTGADLVLSSMDKMIGSAQGGLILGRADLVEAVRKNPLARALRVDKVTLSVLETTLTLFLDEEVAVHEIPTLRMITRTPKEIHATANSVASAIWSGVPNVRLEVIDGFSQMGSGSLPGHDLPTTLVAIEPADGDPESLARRLRLSSPPVFARIAKGQLLIDPRTVLPGEEAILIEVVVKALHRT